MCHLHNEHFEIRLLFEWIFLSATLLVNYKHSVNVVLIGGSGKNDACVLRMVQEFCELEIPSLAVGGLNWHWNIICFHFRLYIYYHIPNLFQNIPYITFPFQTASYHQRWKKSYNFLKLSDDNVFAENVNTPKNILFNFNFSFCNAIKFPKWNKQVSLQKACGSLMMWKKSGNVY